MLICRSLLKDLVCGLIFATSLKMYLKEFVPQPKHPDGIHITKAAVAGKPALNEMRLVGQTR